MEETCKALDEDNGVIYFSKCLNILEDEYNELYEEINWLLPNFLQLVREILKTSRDCSKCTIDKSSQMKLGFLKKNPEYERQEHEGLKTFALSISSSHVFNFWVGKRSL